MAYHLHRLNLTGEPLREALKGKAYLATALSQGRAAIDLNFIAELAAALNIATDELNRAPTDDEAREWSFYRASASNPKAVWQRASEIWTSHGYSLRDAAKIIGIRHADIVNALSGKRSNVFDFKHARKLSDAIGNPIDSLLPSNPPTDRGG